MLRRARDWSGSVVAGPKRKLRIAIACAIGVAAVFGGVQAQGAPASPITVVATASASQVPSGGQLTYTIVVTNTGGAALSSVSLTDQVNGAAWPGPAAGSCAASAAAIVASVSP